MQRAKPGIAKNECEETGLATPGGFAKRKQLDEKRIGEGNDAIQTAIIGRPGSGNQAGAW